MAQHNDFGKNGEFLAKQFLESAGYEILDENWTFEKSEIDLIAYLDKKLIFVEVKTRSSNIFGEPEDFVNTAKEQKMEIAADEYINLMNFDGDIRFDIISILFDNSGKHTLLHIEDAFWPD
jgi:putative endonuclease